MNVVFTLFIRRGRTLAGFACLLANCGHPAVAQTPTPTPTMHSLVDSIPATDLPAAINLLKSNYLNPAAVSDQEITRATLEGLIVRLSPGVSILQTSTADTTGSSPFRAEILDNRIGYLRLGTLSKDTASNMDAALKNFSDQSLKSLVLDLRATPASGDFDSAAEIAGRFCPKGKTLFTLKKSSTRPERSFTSNQDSIFQGVMAVLVDHETCGAAEVIAAILRTEAKALVIGETTCGQAVDYVDLPLRDGKMLRVAVAMVVLPGNRVIFPTGVKPDLTVVLSANEKREILKQSLDKGISPFVFETERPKLNEAALVAGINPELDALEAAQGKKQDANPVLRDTVIQRAVDFITTVGVYEK